MALPTFKVFDELARFNIEFAESMMHKFGHVASILHLFYATKKEEIVQIRIPEGPDNPPLSALVGSLIQQRQADAYMLTAEAWARDMSPEEAKLPADQIQRAKTHPNRYECVTVTGEHPGGTCAYNRRFTRVGNNIVFDQTPLENRRLDTKGNMGSLLRPRG